MMSYLPEGFLINTNENRYYLSSLEAFNKAYTEHIPVEARVTYCDCHHNLHFDFGFIEGIMPREDCAIGIKDGSVRDIAVISKVNKPVTFYIEKISYDNGRAVASLNRRQLQEDFTKNGLSQMLRGDIIDAKITHLEVFGAFCDIGCGITALLPIDNISVSRIPHPNVRFSVGDVIRVLVKEFDDKGRVTLTHKELLGSWEQNARLFKVGETVSGVVRSIESYGIFVELTPNLSGLAEYTDDVNEGDYAGVYIKSIIPEKMKFKLIIVDSFKAEYTKEKPRYFIENGHLDYFRYSPENASKIIETVF